MSRREPLITKPDVWDKDPWLLGVTNGVVDLRTGEHRPGRPSDYMRRACPVEWAGLSATAPVWEQCLSEILGAHDGVIDYVEHGLRLVRAGGTVLIPRVLAGGAVADPVRRDAVTTAYRTLIQETQASPAVLGALSIAGEGLLQLTTVAAEQR